MQIQFILSCGGFIGALIGQSVAIALLSIIFMFFSAGIIILEDSRKHAYPPR